MTGKFGRVVRRVALLLGLGALAGATNEPPFQPTMPDSTLWPQGRFVYERNCLVCHGRFGDGRGEMGKELKPAPRNFNRGIFKYHTTPAGKLPTDVDLERTIRGGLVDTAMPRFQQLSDREIRTVIEYVKSFSPRWRSATNYAPPLPLPRTPDWFADATQVRKRAEAGRPLFQSACAPCHGDRGDGRGPAAPSLTDAWDQPVFAANLRRPLLRSGADARSVYRVLTTGIDGSPMPAFAETLSEGQRWDLTAFIFRLRREEAASAP